MYEYLYMHENPNIYGAALLKVQALHLISLLQKSPTLGVQFNRDYIDSTS